MDDLTWINNAIDVLQRMEKEQCICWRLLTPFAPCLACRARNVLDLRRHPQPLADPNPDATAFTPGEIYRVQ